MNTLWLFFILGGILTALIRAVAGDPGVLSQCMQALTEAFSLTLQTSGVMLGVMGFWLGLFRVAEVAGVMRWVAQGLTPLLRRLMPDIPDGHWVFGAISMNLAANFLGLDNAATPFGLKAMQGLQALNPQPERVSRSQIMFLMLNCNALCWMPVSILAYRIQAGSLHPGLVYAPIVLSSTLGLLLAVSLTLLVQRIRPDALLLSSGAILLLMVLFSLVAYHHPSVVLVASMTDLSRIGDALVLVVMAGILFSGWWQSTEVYTPFIEGARQAPQLILDIFPYLLAMLCALALFRASGLLNYLLDSVRMAVESVGGRTEWLPALPAALMKPFSASAARGWLIDLMHQRGVDSFASLVTAVVQGSTETTFYVMTVYLGSVGIKKTAYALGLGLFSEFLGMGVAVVVSYAFFSVR